MDDVEYTYLVSYAGKIGTDVVYGHIEMTLKYKWGKGDTDAICADIQKEKGAPNNIVILSVFKM